jgi:hypothetical protein
VISPKQLIAVLNDRNQPRTTESFIRVHRHLEGYFKRVMLIGLRIHGVQYETSTRIIDSVHMHAIAQIEKAIVLLDGTSRKHAVVIKEAKREDNAVFVLIELFQNFSALFRNRLVHGVIDNVRDQDTLDSLFDVDLGLFNEFESMLRKKHSRSGFDQPKEWGAKPGEKESIDSIIARLRLGKISPNPIATIDVRKILSDIGHGHVETRNGESLCT